MKVLTPALVLTALFFSSGSIQAQFFGPFVGPFYGPMYAPYQSPTQMVQNRKPITQNVGGPVMSAPDNSNAYWNKLREPVPAYPSALTPRSDLRLGSRGISSPSARKTAKSPASKQTPKQRFLSFFGPQAQLVWPAEAPLEADLSGKRATVDSAMAVLKSETAGTDPIKVASIINARNELLAYGQPALAFLRENRPAQADPFHAWLLDLYHTLGQLTD
ncbi:MAG: hypothetical protein DWI24_06225 [Planctomycetota bacterium]|nr:MAG: hypothetical protein DWI24_06225 [Planctomycetota bacterium]